MNELVLSREVRGAEAAAIAAIHCYQKKLGHAAHPLTFAFLEAKHKEDATLRRDQAAVGVNVSHNYSDFFKHIRSAPRKVFAVERPSLDTITQGPFGDAILWPQLGRTHIEARNNF